MEVPWSSDEANMLWRLQHVLATDTFELALGRYVEYIILTLGTGVKCRLLQSRSRFHLIHL